MTPEPGTEVMVGFRGVTEAAYHSGGHPDGGLAEMLPVRLPGGQVVFVPVVEGVVVGPSPGGSGDTMSGLGGFAALVALRRFEAKGSTLPVL